MKKSRLLLYLALPMTLLLAAAWMDARRSDSDDAVAVADGASQKLVQLERVTERFVDQLSDRWNTYGGKAPFTMILPGEVTALVFEGDSLAWWSGTGISPDSALVAVRNGNSMIRTGNGWYRRFSKQAGGNTTSAFLRIRSDYPFQNKYLVNTFHPGLGIPDGFQISSEGGTPVVGMDGKTEFFIISAPKGGEPEPWTPPALAYMLAILFFHVWVYLFIRHLTSKVPVALAVTGMVLLISRYAGAQLGIPAALHELPFFSPAYYASSLLLNSLADLLTFSIALVLFALALYLQMKRVPRRDRTGAVLAWVFFSFGFAAIVHHLIGTLVLNSKISFNISNVFELSYFTLAGVIITGLLLLALVIVILVVSERLYLSKSSNARVSAFFVLILAPIVLFALALIILPPYFGIQLIDGSVWEMALLVLILFALAHRPVHNRELLSGVGIILTVIAVCSAYASISVSRLNAVREKNERKLIASKLENEQDGIAEYLFEDIAGKIGRDRILTDYFSASFSEQLMSYASNDPVSLRLQQVYFTGYWARYDLSVKCFNGVGLPVNAGGDPSWNLDYFNLLINNEGQPTQSRHLYFLGNDAGQLSYIARIEIGRQPDDTTAFSGGTIILLLKSKMLHDNSGFPALLISDKVPQKKDLSAYSFAEYRNNRLLNQSGTYNYLNNGFPYAAMASGGDAFFDLDGYSHLIYRKGGNGFLMVSVVTPGVLSYITLFSYLFAFFGTLFIIVYFTTRLIRFRGRIRMNFKNRIQAAVILIVLTGMLLVGGATVYFIYTNYEANLNEQVTARLKSVRVAISDLIGMRTRDEEIGEELGYALSGVASTLSSNFNIYTTNGKLIYSTQPKIYEQGIVAPLMDRKALDELKVHGRSYHSRLERTGSLKYLSAYAQLRNNKNRVIGFINLPYYARQEDLKKAISSFLVALINIYVLLFSASLLIAFIISNRITRPLEVIQQNLSSIRLGRRNEPIRWEHQDEIGALVREYNRMVDELAESANRLARSERESAWREMAKQVAHEIKNPLTPMKLSVQHLQRAQKENHPDLEAMVKRVSDTLISQIDTLTNIANEFSSFAQMPKGNNEELDLRQVVSTITDLYSESENVSVLLEETSGNFRVLADKDQLSRVFSNLLKNAVQSIEAGKTGLITVRIYEDKGSVTVSVRDNGIGIPDDRKASLFVPNFTTKTGGTGLGLAMSKNIVEQSGGKIWFESEAGKGTTFYVQLPLIKLLS